MPTSSSYFFSQKTDANDIIRNAFTRCGVNTSLISGLQFKKARSDLNFMLSSWINNGLNLWTVQQLVLPIIPNQRSYALPSNMSRVLECVTAKAKLIIDPMSFYKSGGSFDSALGLLFNPLNTTPVLIGNYIEVTFPIPQPIQYIGIEFSDLAECSLGFYAGFMNQGTGIVSWQRISIAVSQQYFPGKRYWFSLPFTENTMFWRIDANTPVSLTQVCLGIPYTSLPMEPVGRDLYMSFPANSQTGQTSTYYINRSAPVPTLNVWTVPDTSYNNSSTADIHLFVYNAVMAMQDVGDYTNTLNIPPRFLEAATAGLSARLATMFSPEKVEVLNAMAEHSLMLACREDDEKVDLQFSLGRPGS